MDLGVLGFSEFGGPVVLFGQLRQHAQLLLELAVAKLLQDIFTPSGEGEF